MSGRVSWAFRFSHALTCALQIFVLFVTKTCLLTAETGCLWSLFWLMAYQHYEWPWLWFPCEFQQQRMSDRHGVCWSLAALGTCRCPTNAVVGVQWPTQFGNLPPDIQAGGRAVPCTPARRSWIDGLEANVGFSSAPGRVQGCRKVLLKT